MNDITTDPATPAQIKLMHLLWREADVTDRDVRLAITGRIIGREITSSARLTKADARKVIDRIADGGCAELIELHYIENLF